MTDPLDHIREVCRELNKENKRVAAEIEEHKKLHREYQDKIQEKDLEISSLARQVESSEERIEVLTRSSKNLRSINAKQKAEIENMRKTTSIQLVVILILFVCLAGIYMIQQ